MKPDEPIEQKPMHLGIVLLISFLLFTSGFIVTETIRWTDHFRGFVNGIHHLLFFGIGWLMYGLPWYLLGCFLYRKRDWSRYRARWVLVPSALMFAVFPASLVIDPPTAAHRFKQSTQTELPGSLQELHFRFTGGGMADQSDTYYFRTTAEEMESLIKRMRLEPQNVVVTGSDSLPGCPDPSTWKGLREYRRVSDSEFPQWYLYLVTDETKTQAYIRFMRI